MRTFARAVVRYSRGRDGQGKIAHTHYVVVPQRVKMPKGPARNPKRAKRPAGMSGRQWVRLRKAERRGGK